ncbi:tail fiber domain-containing protein [Burkholderia sp. JPY481]
MMADVAVWFAAPEWLNYGFTLSYVSSTVFSTAGDQRQTFTVGRRVRAIVTAGAIYGTIASVVYTSSTAVGVTWDSGALDSGLSEVDIHIVNPALHQNFSLQTLTLNEPGNGNSTLTINGATDSIGAHIKMIGNGATAPNKYLTVLNGVFQIVNSAHNLGLLTIDDSGNTTATGTLSGSNLTASSDERLKCDWEQLAPDFLDCLAGLKSGTYTRVDTNERQVGVGAQSLHAFLPEAVLSDAKGMLSVAYGHAALAACVELAKEVVRLRALVEAK